MKYLVRIIRL